MTVLVTGANGHIGSQVIRVLVDRGTDVVGMVRANADLRGLQGVTVKLTKGDVLDRESLALAMQGCDTVIHTAAVYKTIADSADSVIRPAVEGTQNLFDAAVQQGIKRIVFTSSIAAVGFCHRDTQLRCERDWNEEAHNAYYVAKTQSERLAHHLAQQTGIELVVICPALVLGPGDYRITPSNQLILDWLTGRGQTYRGGLNMVDVRDVAAAHVAALTLGRSGERYIIAGDNMSVRSIGELLWRLTGMRPFHIAASRPWVLIFARGLEWIARRLAMTPLFTYDLAYEVVERYGYYNGDKAVRELAIQQRPITVVLGDCVDWLHTLGRLKSGARITAKHGP